MAALRTLLAFCAFEIIQGERFNAGFSKVAPDLGHPGGVIATWHHQDFNQVDHTGTSETTSDMNAATDYNNKLIPKSNTMYNVTTTQQCCQSSCGGQGTTSQNHEDCRLGCSLWLSHSSLNWESTSWWPQLRERCKLYCSLRWAKTPEQGDEADCKSGCTHYFSCMSG